MGVWRDSVDSLGCCHRDRRFGGVGSRDRSEFFWSLNDIFQWQVDFERDIRPGDFYRFSYERAVRPDGTMRVGHVLSSELVNRGNAPMRLCGSTPTETERHVLRRERELPCDSAFLRARSHCSNRISSRFSNSRFHPVLQTWRAHRGVDYAANRGTPVQATGNGVVIETRNAEHLRQHDPGSALQRMDHALCPHESLRSWDPSVGSRSSRVTSLGTSG